MAINLFSAEVESKIDAAKRSGCKTKQQRWRQQHQHQHQHQQQEQQQQQQQKGQAAESKM